MKEKNPQVEKQRLNPIFSKRNKKETEMNSRTTKLVVTSLLVLVGLTIAVAPAMAQGVSFNATSLPRTVRLEGRTETVGEIVLTSTIVAPNTGTIKAGSSIAILYGAKISNAVTFASNIQCTIAAGTGALANANCPAGMGASISGNQLNITFAADVVVTGPFQILVSGVRVDVSAISGSTAVLAQLSGFSSFPTTNPLTFNQPTVTVGNILASLTITVPRTTTFASPSLATCVANAASAASQFQIRVTENFPSALTTGADENGFSTNGDLNGSAASSATASAIWVVISGVPTGFKVTPIATSLNVAPATLAVTVAAAQNGVTGTALTFKFPVTADNLGLVEQIDLNFQLSNSAGLAAGLGGAITALVKIAPIDTTSVTNTGTTAGPIIVSFADNGKSGTVATLADCVTNLLFPFVANVAGFNTGIAIANTTKDKEAFPFGPNASPQDGTCVVTGYGSADAAVKSFTTPKILSGTTYTFTLGDTGNALNGFYGYMFAQCNFLDAHAFAFVVDKFGAGAPTLAEGYLALVVGAGRVANPSESLGQ